MRWSINGRLLKLRSSSRPETELDASSPWTSLLLPRFLPAAPPKQFTHFSVLNPNFPNTLFPNPFSLSIISSFSLSCFSWILGGKLARRALDWV